MLATTIDVVSHPFAGPTAVGWDGTVFASVLLMGIALSLIPGM